MSCFDIKSVNTRAINKTVQKHCSETDRSVRNFGEKTSLCTDDDVLIPQISSSEVHLERHSMTHDLECIL